MPDDYHITIIALRNYLVEFDILLINKNDSHLSL